MHSHGWGGGYGGYHHHHGYGWGRKMLSAASAQKTDSTDAAQHYGYGGGWGGYGSGWGGGYNNWGGYNNYGGGYGGGYNNYGALNGEYFGRRGPKVGLPGCARRSQSHIWSQSPSHHSVTPPPSTPPITSQAAGAGARRSRRAMQPAAINTGSQDRTGVHGKSLTTTRATHLMSYTIMGCAAPPLTTSIHSELTPIGHHYEPCC